MLVEGMVWLWRETSSQVRLSCQPRRVARLSLIHSSFCLRSGVCSTRAGLCFPPPPPPWYFPLSHAAPLLTACFCWVLDLELWSSAGFVQQLSRCLAYLSLSAPSACLSPLCVPPSSPRCQPFFFCLRVAALCPFFLSYRWFYPLKRSPSTQQTTRISQNFLPLLSPSAFFYSPLV